jgi:hypothetical protein
LAYHWWRFELDHPVEPSWVIERIRSGRLAYKCVGVDILWEVALSEGVIQGDDGAARRFRTNYSKVITAAARKAGGRTAAKELKGFEAELILPRNGRPARLSLYAGHSPMNCWLQQVVRNEWAGRARRRKFHQIQVPEVTADNAPRAEEMAQGHECLELLRPLFIEAVASLDANDAVLLRMDLLDGIPRQDLARLLRVNKSTISRRLQRVCADLIDYLRYEAVRTSRSSELAHCLDWLKTASPGLRQVIADGIASWLRGSSATASAKDGSGSSVDQSRSDGARDIKPN